jgi:hypothetical protein
VEVDDVGEVAEQGCGGLRGEMTWRKNFHPLNAASGLEDAMSVSFPLSLSDQKLEKGLCPRRWLIRSITDKKVQGAYNVAHHG